MDVLVTGTHGLVGTSLVRALRADGHRIRRLVRGRPEGADDVRWDPSAGALDAAALVGVDAVVHLAGAGIGDRRWTEDRKRLILESRTQGTALARIHDRGARPQAPRPRLRDGGGLLRQSRRRDRSPRSPGPATTSPRTSACSGRPPCRRPRGRESAWSTSGPASSLRRTGECSNGCCSRSSSGSAAASARAIST